MSILVLDRSPRLKVFKTEMRYQGEAPQPRLHVCLYSSANFEDIEQLVQIILESLQDRNNPAFALKIEHVGDREIQFPDMRGILHIASNLVKHKKLVEGKLLGTCIQVQQEGTLLGLAKDMLLTVYQPVRPFDVKTGFDQAEEFLCTQCKV